MDCPHCNIKNWREQVMENNLVETRYVEVDTSRADFVLQNDILDGEEVYEKLVEFEFIEE